MTANHRALLVIDMQNAFCHPDGSFTQMNMGLEGVLEAVANAAVAIGQARRAAIPGLLSFEIEGVASRNRSGDPFYIDNTGHPANRRLALARSKATHVHGFGLDLDLAGQGNNGHFAPFAWAA